MSIHQKIKGKRVLITGSRGYIASGLIGDGIDLKNDPTGYNSDIITYRATQKYDVVIHAAAKVSVVDSMKHPREYVRTNITGTLTMLQEHPEAHFIYLSTAGVYGEGVDHTVNSPLKPTSVYAATKLAGEFLVQTMAKSWVILRLTNVIGDGDRGEPNVYQIFKKENQLPIFGDGLQTRDFIEVDKVRETIMNSFDKHGIFNVGSGISKTILGVAKEFNKPLKFLPPRKGELRSFGIKDAVNFCS